MKEFIFGSYIYNYELIKQTRRTMSLTVTPDLRIVLKCPENTTKEKIDHFLQKKWFWLEKQLSFFKKYQRKTYKREYISGEGFLYLGKQYKITVQKNTKDSISLSKTQLYIRTRKSVTNSLHNKKLLDLWIASKTETVFQDRYIEMLKKFDYKNIPRLEIRNMKKRWGSFLNKDKIFLNPKLIHVSKDCIDYVIIHELCHIKYKNHDKKFFNLLKDKYPKWKRVKDKLELFLI